MFRRSTVAATAAAVALFALPAAASAAIETTVAAPTGAALQTAPPTFTWAPVANEAIISITVGTSPTLDSSGSISSKGGTYLSPDVDTATSVTGRSKLAAGTYYWQAWWKTLQPYSSTHGPVNTMVVPAFAKKFGGTITQYGSIPAVSINGSYITNIASNKVLCQIYSGKRVISKQIVVRKYNIIGGKNNFYCSNLKVSERLDGARLKAKISFISGGKVRLVASKAFRAR